MVLRLRRRWRHYQFAAFEAHPTESGDEALGVVFIYIEKGLCGLDVDGSKRFARKVGFVEDKTDDIRRAELILPAKIHLQAHHARLVGDGRGVVAELTARRGVLPLWARRAVLLEGTLWRAVEARGRACIFTRVFTRGVLRRRAVLALLGRARIFARTALLALLGRAVAEVFALIVARATGIVAALWAGA